MRAIFLIFLVVANARAVTCNGFSFTTPFTTTHGQVPSTLSAFPVKLSGTLTQLKTVGNGGHVQNTATQTGGGAALTVPADAWFTLNDATCAATVANEWEAYDATTGAFVVWVLASSLSSGVDDVISACYGKSSITTYQGNVTGTWNSAYISVLHQGGDGSGGISFNDSSASANNATKTGSPTAITGEIDGAATYSGTLQYASAPHTASMDITGDITVETWIKRGTTGVYGAMIAKTNATTLWDYDFYITTTNLLRFYSDTPGTTLEATSNAITDTTTWHHVAFTRQSGIYAFYVDGALSGSGSYSGSFNARTFALFTATDTTTSGSQWNGSMDESRVSNVARASAWLNAGINNTKPSSTFITTGVEVTCTVPSGSPKLMMLGVGEEEERLTSDLNLWPLLQLN